MGANNKKVKTSKWYLVLIILDIILLIMWPVSLFTTTYPVWLAFLVGAVWCSDFYDLGRDIVKYKEHKFYEGFEEV